MNDLFRFLLLRPANPAEPKDIKILTSAFVERNAPLNVARKAARAFVEKSGQVFSPDDLKFSGVARAVVNAIGSASISAKELEILIKKETAIAPVELAGIQQFGEEEEKIANALVAMKLLSDSLGCDAPGLAKLAQGYDAIRQVADGVNPISLRVLSIPAIQLPLNAERLQPDRPQKPIEQSPHEATDRANLEQLEDAIRTLGMIPAAGFHVLPSATEAVRADFAPVMSRLSTLAHGTDVVQKAIPSISRPSRVTQPWLLSSTTLSTLPTEVRNTVLGAGLDLLTQPLPVVLNALHTHKAELLKARHRAELIDDIATYQIGNLFGAIASNDYIGTPTTSLPSSHGNIRPVGIGDLLLVKEHVLRYEGGDLAHVENVLKSERLSRETRRLDRNESTIVQETESTKEEQRDTQTTDRFSLKRETSDTIKTDASLKAGVSVDAKYGPMVEVKANVDYATSTTTESTTKQASEFSKDVIARSASKLVARVLERRSSTTITEFEEKFSHGFDNTQGTGHISGYYQWIDKVMQAQVYNYGKRLLFDVTVPEPGTNFILMQTKGADQGQSLSKPTPFTLSADQINEGNYTQWAAKYQVIGLEPAPPPIKTVSKAYDATMGQDPHEGSKSDTLAIEDGYRAKYALFQWNAMRWEVACTHWMFLLGSNWIDAWHTSSVYFDMSGEIGSVPIAYEAYQIELLAATVEIFCERTERTYAAWQLKIHAAITQGYQVKQRAYEQALAQARASAGVVISGHNPVFNARLVSDELRKQCLTLITAQQFDAFGALELSSQGGAQPNLDQTAIQMPYVRFFEQAFEWEHITYFYYPYFWGWKDSWHKHMLLDDVDPQFADFLRAGAARVVIPVRPGFEAAIIHYLETGEIWNGGPPPDISSSLYLPIVKEIQEATGAPGNEVPIGDPWLVHLPTTLVRLRPNNDLPSWTQNEAGHWVPEN